MDKCIGLIKINKHSQLYLYNTKIIIACAVTSLKEGIISQSALDDWWVGGGKVVQSLLCIIYSLFCQPSDEYDEKFFTYHVNVKVKCS